MQLGGDSTITVGGPGKLPFLSSLSWVTCRPSEGTSQAHLETPSVKMGAVMYFILNLMEVDNITDPWWSEVKPHVGWIDPPLI